MARGRCMACLEDGIPLDGTVCCPSGAHLQCVECFAVMVDSQCGPEERNRFEANGCAVVCQFCEVPGNQRRFSDAAVALNVREMVFAQLMRAKAQAAEKQACAQQEKLFRERLAEMREEFNAAVAAGAAVEDARRHRHHIAEEILTLRCPQCRAAFYDFDGCFALKCNACHCGFCAWCFEDCGMDAHAHVLRCPSATVRGTYHGTWEQFQAAHRERRREALLSYLAGLAGDMRTRVVQACARDLADLGLGDVQ